jgi:hypothetical protein
MFVQRVLFHPQTGRNAELRAVLEEWVQDFQSRGLNTSLWAQRFTSGGDVYSLVTVWDDLATLEKTADQIREDGSLRTFLSKANPLCRRDYDNQLFNAVVRPASPVSGRYIYRILSYPAAGQEIVMHNALAEATRRMQSEGRPQSRLSRQTFAPGGPVYVMSDTLQDLAEFEHYPREKLQAVVPNLGAISRAVTSFELHEVLIPFTS